MSPDRSTCSYEGLRTQPTQTFKQSAPIKKKNAVSKVSLMGTVFETSRSKDDPPAKKSGGLYIPSYSRKWISSVQNEWQMFPFQTHTIFQINHILSSIFTFDLIRCVQFRWLLQNWIKETKHHLYRSSVSPILFHYGRHYWETAACLCIVSERNVLQLAITS